MLLGDIRSSLAAPFKHHPLEGQQAVKDHFAALFAAMLDTHIEIERIAADREGVFVP